MPRPLIESALTFLNSLINKGYEFPDAIDMTLEVFWNVSQTELTAAYDEQ